MNANLASAPIGAGDVRSELEYDMETEESDLQVVLKQCEQSEEAALGSLNLSSDEFVDVVLPVFRRSRWSRLLLFENDLDDNAVTEIAKVIAEGNSILKELDLGWNRITDLGMIAIAQVLSRTQVSDLILYSNEIANAGATNLAQALPQSSVHTVDLNENHITDEGAIALANALPEVPHLHTLDLSKNQITDVGAKHLVEAMRRSHLLFLKLDANDHISQRLHEEIERTEQLIRTEFPIMIALSSVQTVPHLGEGSHLRVLPVELIRRVALILYRVVDLDELILAPANV